MTNPIDPHAPPLPGSTSPPRPMGSSGGPPPVVATHSTGDPAAVSTPAASGSTTPRVYTVGETFPWVYHWTDRDGHPHEMPATATIKAVSVDVVYCDLTNESDVTIGRVFVTKGQVDKVIDTKPSKPSIPTHSE